MSNIIKMTSRKFLLRDLERNIKLNNNKCYEFNDHTFYRDGQDGYRIFDGSENSIGYYDMADINDYFLKTKIVNYTDQEKPKGFSMKSKPIKSKPRKKKRYDIILGEFMGHVKTQPCIVKGCTREGVEAHHVYGRQPARHDNICVPLCAYHHRGSEFSVHEGNVKKFRTEYTRCDMEKQALVIFTEWVSNGMNADLMLKELVEHLQSTDKKHSVAIKEFIIGR